MKIAYFVRDDGACAHYRVLLPIKTLSYRFGHKIAEFVPGDSLDKLVNCLEEAETIVIPRPTEDQFISLMEELKKKGVRIVADHDDNMFNISPLSPHYEAFGVENVAFQMPDGNVNHIWTDGTNIDIKKNKKRIENFKRALSVADMVSVTQPILAELYSKYNPNVKVLPNCIDLNIWKPLPLVKHEGVRMGWAGGHSHYEDWYLLKNVLPKIMNKYKNVTLVILGQKFSGTLKDCPQDRIEHHGWVHTQAYPYKMAALDLDFTLIPLVDNEFNRCKSNIKWIESGALQRPAVTSYVSPYKEWYDGENGVFVQNNDPEAWEDGISFLIENENARERMGAKAFETVKKNFDIWDKCSLWEEAYSCNSVK